MSRFLGVDGGGTKTAFLLIDDTGTVLAETRQPSAYSFADGMDRVRTVLTDGVADITATAGITAANIDHGFFGIPGYGEASRDIPHLDALPASILGHNRYRVDNDMVCGFAGSLAGADGINVISGTGSMTYGEHHGRGVRTGGWGELFGDEGSAFWVAVRGLNAFSRMSDGRLPTGPLADLMRARLGIGTPLDAVDVVLGQWASERGAVADLARVVVAAADVGDTVAAAILHDAVTELLTLVTVTADALQFTDNEPVPVSYSGGLFAAEAVRDSFTAGLSVRLPNAVLRTPRLDPVAGAAVHAATLHGTPLGDAAIAHLTDQREHTPQP